MDEPPLKRQRRTDSAAMWDKSETNDRSTASPRSPRFHGSDRDSKPRRPDAGYGSRRDDDRRRRSRSPRDRQDRSRRSRSRSPKDRSYRERDRDRDRDRVKEEGGGGGRRDRDRSRSRDRDRHRSGKGTVQAGLPKTKGEKVLNICRSQVRPQARSLAFTLSKRRIYIVHTCPFARTSKSKDRESRFKGQHQGERCKNGRERVGKAGDGGG